MLVITLLKHLVAMNVYVVFDYLYGRSSINSVSLSDNTLIYFIALKNCKVR